MKILDTTNDFSTQIQKDNLTIIDFFAEWCGPCKMIAPEFEYLSGTYTNVHFCKVDVDKSPNIAQMCGVSSMPTFLFFKGGELLCRVLGADMESVSSKIFLFGGNLTQQEERLGEVVRDLSDNQPEVLKTIKSVLQNIINFPEDTKFQKIKTTNPKVQKLLEKDTFLIPSLANFILEGEFMVLKDQKTIKQVFNDVSRIENQYNKDFVFDSDNTECIFSNYYEMAFQMNGKTYPCVAEYLKSNSKDLMNAVKNKFVHSKFLLEELLKKKKYICNGNEQLGLVLTQIRNEFK